MKSPVGLFFPLTFVILTFVSIEPLANGMAKVLIGLAMRRRKADKRQVLDGREVKREISRAMSRKR